MEKESRKTSRTETSGFCCYTDCMSNYEGTCRHGLTAGYGRDSCPMYSNRFNDNDEEDNNRNK